MPIDNKQKTLELGTRPVGRLLWQYALPAMVAMVASSLYNIVDRIFIGQIVGPDAIAGLAITFPFMNLSGAFGAAVGIGSSTAISIRLGQRDYEGAENLLGNTVTLNLIVGIYLGLICLLFIDPILRFFGASDTTLPYARSYMEVILLGNVVTHMYLGLNAVLRAASKPEKAMYATIFTVLINVVLDMLFIWWLGWGIRGAAFATVISQLLAMCYQLRLFSNKHEMLHLKRGIYGLRADLVKNIIGIGVSPFLMNVCACMVVIFINNRLVDYGGDLAVGAYGIAYGIAMMFVMFVIGLNQGMQPIAGYNYGSQQIDRLMRVLKLSIIGATCIMVLGWSIGMFCPELVARMFTTDENLIRHSANAMRIVMLVFPIIGYQMVVTNFFQCIGKVKISIFLSLSRQLIILLPMLGILPLFFGLNGVWAAMPVSDASAAVIAAVVMFVFMRKFKLKATSQNNG